MGWPVYKDQIYQNLIDVKPDGSFHLNQEYFNYCIGLTMTNERFDRCLGAARSPDRELLTQRHMDLAASIQAFSKKSF